MSGAPVHKKNLALVRYIHEKSEGRLPIVGVGGIMSPADAKAMLDAGASLVEIYSGFIYEGPSLVKKILRHLEK
jgi:dihydroorotate dehydrogenase